MLCGPCRRALPAPPPLAVDELARTALDGLVAAVGYRGDVERWMQAFKYPGRGIGGADGVATAIVRALARDAAIAASAAAPPPDVVVPVPLHPSRLVARGFNPAAILADEVARAVARRVDARVVERCRDTPTQTGLDRRGRARNVAGAFRCRRAPAARVWLVDDVATTGATLSECARVLRRAGAGAVVAVCAARTPLSVDAPSLSPDRAAGRDRAPDRPGRSPSDRSSRGSGSSGA